MRGDASELATGNAAVGCARSEFGRLDVLFNNAGIDPLRARSVLETEVGDWDRIMDVNVRSAFVMSQAAIPLMREGGSIVTLDFDNSTQAWPFYDWMGVCKAALESVTRYLARDLGRHHIRVNALAAGPLKTA